MRYNEMYLNRIRELSALIFEICLYDLNMKDIDFIDKVINSSIINDLSNALEDVLATNDSLEQRCNELHEQNEELLKALNEEEVEELTFEEPEEVLPEYPAELPQFRLKI